MPTVAVGQRWDKQVPVLLDAAHRVITYARAAWVAEG
jgi:hypothetical protein